MFKSVCRKNEKPMLIYFLGQSPEMMSMLYLMCTHTFSHTQTHRSCRVFRACEKESSPVARQPQPPCSLAHLGIQTHTGTNCGSSLGPLSSTCRPQTIPLEKKPTLTQLFFFSQEKGVQPPSVDYF